MVRVWNVFVMSIIWACGLGCACVCVCVEGERKTESQRGRDGVRENDARAIIDCDYKRSTIIIIQENVSTR